MHCSNPVLFLPRITFSKKSFDIKRCTKPVANRFIVKLVEESNIFHVIKKLGLYKMIPFQPWK
jgi:hypothetical protein